MSIEEARPPTLTADDPDGPWPGRLRGGAAAPVFSDNRLALVGVAIVVLLIIFCFLGPLFYHTDQVHTRISMETLPPGPGHPLGTDNVGYDQLGRLMVGGQISLEVAFAPRRSPWCSACSGARWPGTRAGCSTAR